MTKTYAFMAKSKRERSNLALVGSASTEISLAHALDNFRRNAAERAFAAFAIRCNHCDDDTVSTVVLAIR